jgi:hypothetical protein
VSVVLWDFDGTLAHRPGLCAACVVETLDEHRDNYDADVAGAEAVGIPAVLARTPDARARRSVRTLDELDVYLS